MATQRECWCVYAASSPHLQGSPDCGFDATGAERIHQEDQPRQGHSLSEPCYCDQDVPGTYGTPQHEAWLIEQEREDDRWAGQPDVPTRSEVGGCGCAVSQIYGGDCAHTAEQEVLA